MVISNRIGGAIHNYEFRVLGDLAVRGHGESVAIGSAKQRVVLARLLVDAGAFVSTDALIDALWGDDPPASAAKNLQVLVGRLREAIEPGRSKGSTGGVITSGPGGYRIDPAVTIDARQFELLVERARLAAADERWDAASRELRAALALWRGPAYAEFAEADWARPAARRLDEQRLEAVERRLAADLELGRHGELVGELDDLVARHPSRETLRRLQMIALYRSGRQVDALAAYRELRSAMQAELGLEPGPELRELERRILEQDPSLQTRPRMRMRLPAVPVPPTRTFGREQVLERLRERTIDDAVRLITVTGWGGTGKTRVASELGRRVADAFDDVGYVELAPIAEASMVPSALEAAFGITQSEGDPVDALARFLGDRQLLLVLDNFEHVLDAAPVVTRLLEACPNLTILVTSRTRLGVYGEHEFPLEPLAVPSTDDLDSPGALLESPALRLFEARGREANPDFAVNEENAGAIARICARVDGLPLGIELAAARVKLLSPIDILARLDHRLTLLTSGAESLPARQRSLRAAIEWSYELLSEVEQRVFRMLGVFAGGCTVEAALQVGGQDEMAVLDALEGLVQQNLVRRVQGRGGVARLSMLETIGEFAGDLIEGDPEVAVWRSRHAEYFAGRADRANNPRDDDRSARRALADDLQNIHAAIRWGAAQAPEVAGRTLVAMVRYYTTEGPLSDGATLAGEVMAGVGAMAPATRAWVYFAAGKMIHRSARGDEALQLLRAAVRLGAESGEDAVQVRALVTIADLVALRGDFEEATRLCGRAETLARSLGDRWLVARVLACRAHIAADSEGKGLELAREAQRLMGLEGDRFWKTSLKMTVASILMFEEGDESLRLLAETVAELREMGYDTMAAHAMAMELRVFIEQRRFEEAAAKSHEAVAAARDGGDSLILLFGLVMQAVALMQIGDLERAADAAVEGLEIEVRTNAFRFSYYLFAVLGESAFRASEPYLAARTFGAIDTDWWDPVYDLDVWLQELVDRRASELAEQVGAEEWGKYAGAWRELELAQKIGRLLEQHAGAIERAG